MRKALATLKKRFDKEIENPSWIMIGAGIVAASTYSAILSYYVWRGPMEVLEETDDFLLKNYPDVHADILKHLTTKYNDFV